MVSATVKARRTIQSRLAGLRMANLSVRARTLYVESFVLSTLPYVCTVHQYSRRDMSALEAMLAKAVLRRHMFPGQFPSALLTWLQFGWLGWAVCGWFVGFLFFGHTPIALQRSALFPFSLLETDCTRLIAGNFASLFFGALVWRVAVRFVGSFCFGWLVGLRR